MQMQQMQMQMQMQQMAMGGAPGGVPNAPVGGSPRAGIGMPLQAGYGRGMLAGSKTVIPGMGTQATNVQPGKPGGTADPFNFVQDAMK